ncbi:glutamate ABC transporter substrate-binding protein [Corynebacterium sp.]|uniref:glutamate ABC transporter substrate-binding protein n=1 Tax=Corynebacterium sp. TaxID=1720 RepID=UPI00257F5708|nr:glutamate ABC transporter substrate-binding protein [Corynebacterium sp.]MBS5168140.1 glutamate ABC transporter substrate-binding protein [Corynebacterium sp.]
MIVPFSPSLRGLAGWRRRAILGALTVAGLTVSACATDSLADDPYSRTILEATGDFPLPPGAFYDKASSRKPAAEANTPDLSTLAPDDQTPEERIPEIYQRGRIIVGVDQSLNLLSFRDFSSGELSGFEVSLAQEIARDIFDNPDAVEFRFVDSNERTAALEDGTVDVVLRTMTVTDARRERVLFSTPYLTARAGVLVSSPGGDASPEDVEDGRICVSRGSTTEDLIRRLSPNNTLLLVGNWSDCLISLQNSQAEIVVADDTILAGINDQDPATAIVQRGLNEESYAAGVSKGNPGLVRQINATLERMASDGTWQSLYDTWFGPFLPSGTQPSPQYSDDEDILGISPTPEAAPEGEVDNR